MLVTRQNIAGGGLVNDHSRPTRRDRTAVLHRHEAHYGGQLISIYPGDDADQYWHRSAPIYSTRGRTGTDNLGRSTSRLVHYRKSWWASIRSSRIVCLIFGNTHPWTIPFIQRKRDSSMGRPDRSYGHARGSRQEIHARNHSDPYGWPSFLTLAVVS